MKGFIINHELNRIFVEESDAVEETFFYGILEDGRSFIWKQTQPYILAFLNTPLPEKYNNRVWKKIENIYTDFRKNPVWGYFFRNQNSLNELQAEYPDLDYHESDMIAGEQFLMSKHIRGSVEFLSDPQKTENNIVYFTDPEVKAVKDLFIPSVRVLSLDIETGVESNEIYAIGLYGSELSQVLLQDSNATPGKVRNFDWGEVKSYPNEVELLKGFQKLIQEYNPHVFIGWNVMGFDFSFILRKFTEHRIKPEWGLGNSQVIFFKSDKGKSSAIVKVPGRAILEGIDVVKCLFDPLPNYKLNTAAEYILDEKKTIEKEGKAKIEEIERLYHEDKDELARYNLYDAELVYKIFDTLNAIDFVFNASILSGVVSEKIFNPHEVMDRYYIPLLHKYKITAYRRLTTQVQIQSPVSDKEFSGGFYNQVVVLELKDIFLSVIMAYRIDPLGMIRAHIDKDHASMIPNGVYFHNQDHILPGIIKNLLDLKLEADKGSLTVLKAAIEKVLQQISTCFGSTYSRFFLPGLYNVLESNVRLVIEAITNRMGNNQVIYYDNSCLAVALEEPFENFSQRIPELISKDFLFNLFSDLEQKDHYLFNVKRILYFEEFFMPKQTAGLKSKSSFKYWALDSQGIFIKTKNVKSSLNLIDKICDQIIYRLLKKEDIETYLRDFKKSLLAGDLNHELIFKKKLLKKPSEYAESSSIPPQAVAALKAKENFEGPNFFQKNVEYYQTLDGPEPVQALKSKLDYPYYLEKEFLPALEGIFAHSNKKSLLHIFQNQDHQLSLF